MNADFQGKMGVGGGKGLSREADVLANESIRALRPANQLFSTNEGAMELCEGGS